MNAEYQLHFLFQLYVWVHVHLTSICLANANSYKIKSNNSTQEGIQIEE